MLNLKNTARAALLTVTSGTLLAASLAGGGAAQAGQVHPAGWSSVESCTGLSGAIDWHPGLLNAQARTGQAVVTGTLAGCSGFNGAQAGAGTVSAVLSGTSKVGSVVETGTLTVNWPAAANLNPSNATVTLRRAAPDQPYTLSGTVSSGAFTGASLSTSVLATSQKGTGTTRHPVVHQGFVNTTPLAARVNFG